MKNNLLIVIQAPFASVSGYGAHSRDLIRALIYQNKKQDLGYDIKLVSTAWGQTPQNALEEDDELLKYLLTERLQRKPDVFIQVAIPNEFITPGEVNIGITAGVETNKVSKLWIESCNKMNLIIVPSMFAKEGLLNTKYKIESGTLKIKVPIAVLFEAINEAINNKRNPFDPLKDINEKFCFLHVGQWGAGGFGEDRKNIGKTIYYFLKTFKGYRDEVALVLKTSGAGFSLIDYERQKNKIQQIKQQLFSNEELQELPNIYLLHGNFSDTEMFDLYSDDKIKTIINFAHGEGFGRPTLEFIASTGKPILFTNWSGHLDYLRDCPDDFKVAYELKEVPKSVVWENVILPDSKWAYADEGDAIVKLSTNFFNYDEQLEQSKGLFKDYKEKYSIDKMGERFVSLIEKYKKTITMDI